MTRYLEKSARRSGQLRRVVRTPISTGDEVDCGAAGSCARGHGEPTSEFVTGK